MPTIDKAGKPTILTESEQVLNDLKSELVELKSRMSSIEQEQEQNRLLVERLTFQEELTNEAIKSHHQEVKANQENYQVIANVMNNLKSPVKDVVSNLSGVIADIDDPKTQKTLEECMNTASHVLQSFDDVEDFCNHAGSEINTTKVNTEVRDFFRDVLLKYQNSNDFKGMEFKLLVDKHVPQNSALHCEAIKACFENIIYEICNVNDGSLVTIRVSTEKQEEKYGFKIEDLIIAVEWNNPSEIMWQDSWLASIQTNHERLLNSGLNLLKTREIIRKSGGHMEVTKKNHNLQGFFINMPLSY